MSGRPTKLTPDTKAKLLQAISVGATYEHAAAFAGIHYDTFNEWMKKGAAAKSGEYAEFSEQVKKAEAAAVVKWSALIDKAANDGEWQAAAWKLERRYPATYGRRVHQHDFSRLSNDELRHIIAETTGDVGGGDDGGETAGA